MQVVYEWPSDSPSKLTNTLRKLKSKLIPNKMSTDDRTVLTIHPDNLPDANKDDMANSLASIVEHSSATHDLTQGIHAHSFHIIGGHWIHSLIPGLQKLYVQGLHLPPSCTNQSSLGRTNTTSVTSWLFVPLVRRSSSPCRFTLGHHIRSIFAS